MPFLKAFLRAWANARRRAGAAVAVSMLAMFAHITGASSSSPTPSEYQIKAVFLFNFAQFVEWPPTAFASDVAPFCIGVLGDDPFGANLDEVVRDERVGGRTLVVKRVRQLDDARDCQMLFISRSETRRIGDVLDQIREQPVLTVADIPGFVERGGILGFAMEENHVRLRANPAAAQAARLKISSKLLRSARLVNAK